MKNSRFIIAISVLMLVWGVLSSRSALACGHDGFFIGAGYQQLFMYTTESQLTGQQQLRDQQISFGPGYGAHLLLGYDFESSRWGIQFPAGYDYMRLNHSEWVHHFDVSAEAILHLAAWDNGIDISLVGGVGASIMPEGQIDNNSGAVGIHGGIGPAFNYFFMDGETKGSIYIQVPIRIVNYFGDNLSRNGTTALQIPIRLGISFGGW